jgi:Nucleotidyl transferase
MKVVLFCGGLGTRLREYSDTVPKPMVNIGYRPIIWHLMKYYAHYGQTEFILCLGYRGDLIKQYFLDYNECLSNDFELVGGTKQIRLYGRDIEGGRSPSPTPASTRSATPWEARCTPAPRRCSGTSLRAGSGSEVMTLRSVAAHDRVRDPEGLSTSLNPSVS